ncbi:hypothetical protein [Novosphingobium sp. FSW06-99]|uniref:hypothetical protein n=1 Tax=Novosphingobium sp. FSW06-99 TaxID=1739113 RepID=UPI001E5508FA|nr:hypothetical protein [Novosphingobium sp. FSW06-99]
MFFRADLHNRTKMVVIIWAAWVGNIVFDEIIEVLEKLIAALEAADLPQPAAHLSEAIDALEVETERASSTQILKLNIAYHGKKV